MRPGLVIACALLASCSKRPSDGVADAGASSAATAALAHPCQVLLRADAEPILGTSNVVETEQPAGQPGDAHCLWAVSGGRGFVELRIQVPSRKDSFGTAGGARKALPGIGDAAFVQSRASWGHVDVLKNGQTFFVQVKHPDAATGQEEVPDKLQQEAAQLARVVASRM